MPLSWSTAERFEISAVSSADQALEAVKDYEFDLLLIDVKMPKHDGFFLMREIKKDVPEMPVIIMSGYPTPETIAGVLKSGATQFIPKPFRPDELIKTDSPSHSKDLPQEKSFPTGAG